eukprot:TRINITY_DN10992_c0_g1_i1.p1 TRINITY_DN10992_c0_g1~~TRINITY_DN10992_c0_g1_i1.p1  ORF type:complete len:1064 (+),score=189.95 TRINITY_DN10992_c0_g1_i1:58-3249(+)
MDPNELASLLEGCSDDSDDDSADDIAELLQPAPTNAAAPPATPPPPQGHEAHPPAHVPPASVSVAVLQAPQPTATPEHFEGIPGLDDDDDEDEEDVEEESDDDVDLAALLGGNASGEDDAPLPEVSAASGDAGTVAVATPSPTSPAAPAQVVSDFAPVAPSAAPLESTVRGSVVVEQPGATQRPANVVPSPHRQPPKAGPPAVVDPAVAVASTLAAEATASVQVVSVVNATPAPLSTGGGSSISRVASEVARLEQRQKDGDATPSRRAISSPSPKLITSVAVLPQHAFAHVDASCQGSLANWDVTENAEDATSALPAAQAQVCHVAVTLEDSDNGVCEVVSLGGNEQRGRSLNLSNRKLTDIGPLLDISSTFASEDLGRCLLRLVISGNEFADAEALAVPLSRLESLTELDMSSNRLSRLPMLQRLRRLVRFDASRNSLKSSRGLLYCASLQFVSLAHNQLRRVEQLETLQALDVLDVSHNKLGPTPLAALRPLAACRHLRELRVEGNPLSAAGTAHRGQLASLIPSLIFVDRDKVRFGRATVAPGHLQSQGHCAGTSKGNHHHVVRSGGAKTARRERARDRGNAVDSRTDKPLTARIATAPATAGRSTQRSQRSTTSLSSIPLRHESDSGVGRLGGTSSRMEPPLEQSALDSSWSSLAASEGAQTCGLSSLAARICSDANSVIGIQGNTPAPPLPKATPSQQLPLTQKTPPPPSSLTHVDIALEASFCEMNKISCIQNVGPRSPLPHPTPAERLPERPSPQAGAPCSRFQGASTGASLSLASHFKECCCTCGLPLVEDRAPTEVAETRGCSGACATAPSTGPALPSTSIFTEFVAAAAAVEADCIGGRSAEVAGGAFAVTKTETKRPDVVCQHPGVGQRRSRTAATIAGAITHCGGKDGVVADKTPPQGAAAAAALWRVAAAAAAAASAVTAPPPSSSAEESEAVEVAVANVSRSLDEMNSSSTPTRFSAAPLLAPIPSDPLPGPKEPRRELREALMDTIDRKRVIVRRLKLSCVDGAVDGPAMNLKNERLSTENTTAIVCRALLDEKPVATGCPPMQPCVC